MTGFFTGCQKDVDELAPAEKRNVMIEVSVSAGKMTRSTPTDTETAINTLRIFAFYNDKLAGYTENQYAGEPVYIDLELPESGIHNVDFYVIANENEMAFENVSVSINKNMSKTELEALKFTGLLTGSVLPMYCKETIRINVDEISDIANSEAGHEGHFVLSQKVNFTLQRSLAKLSVYAAKESGTSSNPQILNTVLLAGGTRLYSYLFPQTPETLNSVPSRDGDRTLSSSIVSISKSIDKTNETAIKEISNYDEVFIGEYMPEVTYGSTQWNISSGNNREAVLHIEYTLGERQQLRNAYVYLPPVQRNHHIKVCIFINSEGNIIINYDVAPWDDNTETELSFTYPTHSYLRQSIPTSQEEIAIKPTSVAQMSENEPFVGYFQLLNPTNDHWTPTLLGLNSNNCHIRIFESNTTIEIPEEDFPIRASDKWYRIEVHPNENKMKSGDEVQLAITYTASGFEQREFLLINGSYQEYYWPYEGTSNQDANYVIITTVN